MMIRLMRWIIGSGDKKRLAKQFDPADDLVKYWNVSLMQGAWKEWE